MRHRLIAAAAAVLVSPFVAPFAAAQTPTPTPPPYASDERPMLLAPQPVADPDGADAILFNPAGLAMDASDEIVFIHGEAIDGDRAGDGDALFFKSARLLNLGIEWTRPAKDVDLPVFTFATGLPIDRNVSLGVGYSTTMGKLFSDTAFESWNAGALVRPHRMVSLGGTVWNALGNGGSPALDQRARYAGGIAIRPLPMAGWNERFTLAMDVAKTDGQRGEDVRVSARVEPFSGLQLYATADEHERYIGGFTFSFNHGGIGSQAFVSDGDVDGTSTRIRSRQRRQPTRFKLRDQYAKIGIGGALPDQSASTLFSDAEATLPELLATLDKVRHDPNVDGVLVRMGGFGGGMARAQEVRSALIATRAAGKKIYCWMENADTRTYYVASACDRIALHPAGQVSIDGVSSSLGYMRGTLRKVGVQVEVSKVGEYKGAPEPFTLDAPTKETLEVVNALLDASFEQYVEGIAKGRALEPGQVRALIDGAFYPAPRALEQKLVDALAYPDEIRDAAKEFLGKGWVAVDGYGAKAPASREWATPPQIGVIYATGSITEGESNAAPFTGEAILGSNTLVRALRQAKSDSRVKAVVLRVDSPGGSGFASDEVWHEVEKVRKVKPVVVSMADVAASGGYYIAMGANEIFASPGTVTGSIGVFVLRPNFEQLYGKIDYKSYQYSRGALAELFSPHRPMNDLERQTLDRLVNEFYVDFIGKAAKGRNTTPEAIDAVGRGHVWVGTRAHELKLVDTLGGIEEAVARAKQLAKIPKTRRTEWKTFPEAVDPFARAAKPGIPDEIRAAVRALPAGDALAMIELMQAMGNGPIPWLPWTVAPEGARPRAKVYEERLNPWWPLPDFTAPLATVETIED